MKRIHYIDVVETIAMYLVIFCHYTGIIGTSVTANVTLQLATTFAVPLFFMANGALLFSKSSFDLKKHLQKTAMIFLSVFLWKLLYLIVMFIRDFQQYSAITGAEISDFLLGKLHIESVDMAASHFWFMYTLIGVYLIFPFLKIAYDHQKSIIKWLVLFLFVFVFLFAEYQEWTVIISQKTGWTFYSAAALKDAVFPFAESGNFLFYFIIGDYLHRKYYKSNITNAKKGLLLLGSIFGFATLIATKYMQTGTLSGEWIRLGSDYQRVGTLIMSGCFFAFCSSINFSNSFVNKICAFVSVRTMNIYAVHMLLCAFFTWYYLPSITVRGTQYNLLRALVIMILSIVITEPLTYIPGIRTVLGLKPKNIKTVSNQEVSNVFSLISLHSTHHSIVWNLPS